MHFSWINLSWEGGTDISFACERLKREERGIAQARQQQSSHSPGSRL